MDTQSQTDQTSRRRRRAVLGSLTGVLLVTVLVLVISPTLFAQNRNETDRALDVLESVFRFVEENYVGEVDPQILLEGALDGLFESLDDPYSVFMDERAMRSLNDTLEGSFGGVGIYISKQQEDDEEIQDGFIEVISPIEGTPADRANIRAGDLIVGIASEDIEGTISTAGLTIDEVVGYIRGEPGTTVTLTIRRGTRAEFPVDLLVTQLSCPRSGKR